MVKLAKISTFIFSILLSLSALAATPIDSSYLDAEQKALYDTLIKSGHNVDLQLTDSGMVTLFVVKEENSAAMLGLKKDALVYALKYGGRLVGDLVSLLSKKNGDLVKKHSYEIGSALDRFSNSIEAYLIDFMIFELGFPPSAARSIAWAIMQLI